MIPFGYFIGFLFLTFIVEQFIYRVLGREDRFDIMTVLCFLLVFAQSFF